MHEFGPHPDIIPVKSPRDTALSTCRVMATRVLSGDRDETLIMMFPAPASTADIHPSRDAARREGLVLYAQEIGVSFDREPTSKLERLDFTLWGEPKHLVEYTHPSSTRPGLVVVEQYSRSLKNRQHQPSWDTLFLLRKVIQAA